MQTAQQSEMIKIEKPIACSHCEFATMSGKEMYDHLFHKHSMHLSDMAYAMSWAVGSNNTYLWLVGNSNELKVNQLRKCSNCQKPNLAYTRKDDCDSCQKLPEVAKFLKYSKNRSLSIIEDKECYYDHKITCVNCGNVSPDYTGHYQHGTLTTASDGYMEYKCFI